MKRRNRMLLWILGAVAVATVGGGLALREESFLRRLPHGTRDRMPGHWRIPAGLPAEVRHEIEALYLPGAADRRAAAEALGRLGPEAAPALRFLMALLASEGDEGHEMPTMPALPFIGRPGGGKFGNLFGNPNPTWREWFGEMIDYWTSRDDPDRVPQLAPDADEAGTALARIGPAAFEPLVAALNDPLRQVRERAARALGIMGDGRATAPLVCVLEEERRLHESHGDRSALDVAAELALVRIWRRAIESAISDLDASSLDERARAETILQWLVKADLGAQSQDISEDPRPGGQDEPPAKENRCLELLFEAIRSPKEAAFEAGASALMAVRDPRIAPILVQFLHNEDLAARAEIALINIGKPAVGPVIAALKDTSPAVRATAAGILGRIRDDRALGPLLDARNDEDAGVRACVRVAVERLTPPAKAP